jgi:drug/metabolite transporter (DMT)-like permease
LFRGLAPIMVAAGAALFAGEYLSPRALMGVGLISAGLMALAFFGGHRIRASLPALGWGLLTSMFIAAYTVLDGMGVRVVENSLSYILWLFVFEALPIGAWLVITQRQRWFTWLGQNRAQVLGGGLASSAAYGLVIYAMSIGAMALVSSLRETSVIFAALIGTLLLKEPFGRQRIIAACLVAVGVIVIRYQA